MDVFEEIVWRMTGEGMDSGGAVSCGGLRFAQIKRTVRNYKEHGWY